MMRRFAAIVCATVAACALFAAPSSADPIFVGGFVTFRDLPIAGQPSVSFILDHPGQLFIDGSWSPGEIPSVPHALTITRPPAPHPALGQPVNLSTKVTFTGGSATAPGIQGFFPIDAQFQFTGGTVPLEAIPGDEFAFGLDLVGPDAPASFTGVIRGFDPETHKLLFQDEVASLHGRGSVQLSSTNPHVFSYGYSFRPIPEPGTLLLFGLSLGLAFVVWGSARRDEAAEE